MSKYRPTCRKCWYYNQDYRTLEYVEGSFCGLHGCEHIDEPDKYPPPPLAHGRNHLGYDCDCGFFPRYKENAVQLTLF